MKYPEFFQSLRELRMTISHSFLSLCHYIYPSKDLRNCVVNPNKCPTLYLPQKSIHLS